jgi:hypothetical protein
VKDDLQGSSVALWKMVGRSRNSPLLRVHPVMTKRPDGTGAVPRRCRRKETKDVDPYYDIDPHNRRYSEAELREIRERYLVKEVQADGVSRNEERWRSCTGLFEAVTGGNFSWLLAGFGVSAGDRPEDTTYGNLIGKEVLKNGG